jgi:hypothetical protein
MSAEVPAPNHWSLSCLALHPSVLDNDKCMRVNERRETSYPSECLLLQVEFEFNVLVIKIDFYGWGLCVRKLKFVLQSHSHDTGCTRARLVGSRWTQSCHSVLHAWLIMMDDHWQSQPETNWCDNQAILKPFAPHFLLCCTRAATHSRMPE